MENRIETENLKLRKLLITDKEDFYNYLTDERIATKFGFDIDEETSFKRLEKKIKNYEKQEIITIWAIEHQEDQKMVGIISFTPLSKRNKWIELTYGIIEEYSNKGYMTEALKALINYIFENSEVNRIQVGHPIANIAGEKVISKCGFTYEATLREASFENDKFVDRKVYSLLRKEWGNKS